MTPMHIDQAATPAGGQAKAACTTAAKSNGIVVRLAGEIEDQLVLDLCDEIELAIEYYHYREIEIRINSPGGSVAALEHYMDRLKRWRRGKELVIATTAMSTVSSAAAVILSLGTIGHRRAHASARLLYHNVRTRMPGGGYGLTAEQLLTIGKGFDGIDKHISGELLRHIGPLASTRGKIRSYNPGAAAAAGEAGPFAWINLDPRQEGQLEEHYSKLNLLDTPIDPWTARDMLLIDEVIE